MRRTTGGISPQSFYRSQNNGIKYCKQSSGLVKRYGYFNMFQLNEAERCILGAFLSPLYTCRTLFCSNIKELYPEHGEYYIVRAYNNPNTKP